MKQVLADGGLVPEVVIPREVDANPGGFEHQPI